MSGDWIKMEVALPEKPEVWQIAGILRLDPDAVVGKLLKVWRWFDAHTETGNAHGVTYALVDSIVGVTGFAEAMALCGWLVQDGSTLSLPNFDHHNGKTAKNRALTAKRVARSKEKSNAKGNGASVTSALPREEKRREEVKQERAPAKGAKAPEQTLGAWLIAIADADAVPADDPIFGWAGKQGIPADWLGLAWASFEDRYTGTKADKTYADWRAAFRDHVKRGWLDVWRLDARTGGYVLTTAGEQWRREVQS